MADENISRKIIKALRERDYEVISIAEEYIGSSDEKVIGLSKKFNALILTQDSDFGEWVFSHREKDISVVFLRYKPIKIDLIINSLILTLEKYDAGLFGKFIVITPDKIRIRRII